MHSKFEVYIEILLLSILTGIGWYVMTIDICNLCSLHETQIKAQHIQNQNIYDTIFEEILTNSKITDNHTKDLKNLYNIAMKSQAANNDIKNIVQFLKKCNPTLNIQMCAKIQNSIESSRTDFLGEQKMLLDKKQAYIKYRNHITTDIISNFMGFPKIDLNNIGIVTSDETKAAFKTKKATLLKLN